MRTLLFLITLNLIVGCNNNDQIDLGEGEPLGVTPALPNPLEDAPTQDTYVVTFVLIDSDSLIAVEVITDNRIELAWMTPDSSVAYHDFDSDGYVDSRSVQYGISDVLRELFDIPDSLGVQPYTMSEPDLQHFAPGEVLYEELVIKLGLR